MFCASWRWRKWRTRRRKAAAATSSSVVERVVATVGLREHFGIVLGPWCLCQARLCHRAPAHGKIRTARPQGQDSRHPRARPAATPRCSRRLFRAGADAFRVNLSHGDHKIHAKTIAAVRALEKEFNRPIAILCDLQGPKLRVGSFTDGQATIGHGSQFTLDRDPAPGDANRVCLPHPELFEVLKAGQRLLINDGKIRLRVTDAEADKIVCTAEVGGVISDRKGVNVPDAEVPIPALTEKDRARPRLRRRAGRRLDRAQLRPAARGPDRGARADGRQRRADAPRSRSPQAIHRLDEIIELADGVMVARGDLGVELRPEEVPPLQKRIVNTTRLTGKPVIVATQMLESMIESPAPTRAEVSDVANAVYDGVDAVMLSAETAAGQWPEEAVMMMDSIARQVERDEGYRQRVRLLQTHARRDHRRCARRMPA